MRLSGMPKTQEIINMSDEQIQAKLFSVGAKLSSEQLRTLLQKADNISSALESISKRFDLSESEEFFFWGFPSLRELWKRWQPECPCIELVEYYIEEGIEYEEKKDDVSSSEFWLKAWRDLRSLMDTHNLKTIDELDKKFQDSNYHYAEWLDSFLIALSNAAKLNPEYHEKKINLCRELLAVSSDDDSAELSREYFKRTLAESLSDSGDKAAADQLYTDWLAETPRWGWGWIGWSDLYYLFAKNKDYAKAEEILKKGLQVSEVGDRAVMLRRLCQIYEESGRNEDAARARMDLAAEEKLNPAKPSPSGKENLDSLVAAMKDLKALEAARKKKSKTGKPQKKKKLFR